MANPRAFISFDFDHDADSRTLFVGQAKNSSTPFTIEDWSSKEVLAQSKWEEIIADKIGRCHMVIVLVGKYMASATGVAKEIKMAQNKNIPFFGVYVNGGDIYSNLPTGLTRSKTIPWTWAGVASMIEQMKNEGKNVKGFF